MSKDFRTQSIGEWKTLCSTLSGSADRVEWRELYKIVEILQSIGKQATLNHVFHPGGGGLDLTDSTISVEPNCLIMDFDGIHTLVRPDILELVNFANDPLGEWSYFRLDCAELQPSGVYKELEGRNEELLQLEPGKYAERSYWDENFYGYDDNGHEIPLPDGACVIERVFRGSFVIFAKASTYNMISETYDGRHNKMSAIKFREYINKSIEVFTEKGLYGKDPRGRW